MRRDALELLQEQWRPEEIVIDGDSYTTRPVHLPPPEPTAETLAMSSLGSVVDYLQMNADGLALARHVIHVASERSVRILGPLQDRHRQREVVVEALAPACTIPFGRMLSLDELNILLLSAFAESETWAALVKATGNVDASQEINLLDDGMSQRATVRTGVASKDRETLPRKVELAPYRTFREVEQPESLFLLRLKGGGDDGVLAGLWESDGGAWVNEAKRRVAERLTTLLAGAFEAGSPVRVIW